MRKSGVFCVCRIDGLDLLRQPRLVEAVGDAEALGVIGDRDIVVAPLPRRPDDGLQVMAAVGPFGVDVEVALDIPDLTRSGSLPSWAASISPASSRSSGGMKGSRERLVHLLLRFAGDPLFARLPEHAVLVDLEAGAHRHLAELDVVLLAAGEILEGRPEGALFHHAQVDLDALIGDDR